MEKRRPIVHSHSVHSLAENSEPISEGDEITEVKVLRYQGDQAFDLKDYNGAIQFYTEALQIDEMNVEILGCRAAVYVEQKKYAQAQKDATQMLAVNHMYPQGHYVMGVTLNSMAQPQEAISSFLSALALDKKQEDMFADSIIGVVGSLCQLKKSILNQLYEMDAYKKLTEAGVFLYQAKRYDLAIKVLRAALDLETNQKGITMKLQLTMANAHAALRHTEPAIALFQDCLANAVATHDSQYQTKSLVSIASLYLEAGDTYQAVVYYEKLLHLKTELRGGEKGDTNLPEYWTKELNHGLYLNLSIAYKTIGNLQAAEKYARVYLELVDGEEKSEERAESYCNVGLLNEIIGNYEVALEHFLKYRDISKAQGHKTHLAQSYGCLGSVYGAMHNWTLSITFHEQHVNMCKKMSDSKMLAVAMEQMGDTYMLKQDYESAIKTYRSVIPLLRKEGAKRSRALCKLGTAFKMNGRGQYALYYFEQAASIAEDLDLTEVVQSCEFNMAVIMQASTQLLEIEKSQKYFQRLIPALEQRVRELVEGDAVLPPDLESRIQLCYIGIQAVLSKLGNKEECLQYSEASHRRYLSRFQIPQSVSSSWSYSGNPIQNWWHIDKINHVVNSQSATVLYYSVLPRDILIWVLKPGSGLVRFYVGKSPPKKCMPEYIAELCEELSERKIFGKQNHLTESRSLPQRNVDLERLRSKNAAKSFLKKVEESIDTENGPVESSVSSAAKKSIQRVVYDLLVSPVEDVLSGLDQGSPVIVIPDKELFGLPFGLLRDWRGQLMKERFRTTIVPSLYILEKLTKHELDQLRVVDDLEFERSQTRLGGLTRMLATQSRMKMPHNLSRYETMSKPTKETELTQESLNARQTSNPRFYKSGRLSDLSRAQTSFQPEGTFMSLASKLTKTNSRQSTNASITLPPTPSIVKRVNQSWPSAPPGDKPGTHMERLLGAENMSTIVTKTATNTDIVMCTNGVTEFKQICDPDKMVIFGNPKLSKKMMLFEKEWKPPPDLEIAQKEAFRIADITDGSIIVGSDATKERFLSEIQSASIIHIACLASIEEGFIALSPNPIQKGDGPPSEMSYIVKVEDIVSLKLSAKLVVLSCGRSTYNMFQVDQGFLLPSTFLMAGALSVLTVLWTVPSQVTHLFFTHFYAALRKNIRVTHALNEAQKAIAEDERFESVFHWSPFVLVGSDVIIDAKNIKRAQLHQQINEVEKQVQDMSAKDILNPKPFTEQVTSREDNMRKLQGILGDLIVDHAAHPDVIQELISLTERGISAVRLIQDVDMNLKRLNTEGQPLLANTLSNCLHENRVAIELLHFLGYHFEAQGVSTANPFIMYPHWDTDDTLIPTLESLVALLDLGMSRAYVLALHEFMPGSQEVIANIIDVLSITKHASEIQLKTSDLSVIPLWRDQKVKSLLVAIGFHQIGTLLNFTNTPAQRKLLNASLHLFLSVSCYKSPVLMHKLDVTLLGPPSEKDKESERFAGSSQLPSLSPVHLPRYQIKMSTPWLTHIEEGSEMRDKIKLARSKSDVTSQYSNQARKAKVWHQKLVEAQANRRLQKVGQPKINPPKVKVKSGSAISQQRVPVDYQRELTILETAQRRDYNNYVFGQRVKNISTRHRDNVRKLYMPFVQDA